MIRHQVYVRFRMTTTPECIARLMEQLHQLQQKIIGAEDFQYRKNISTETHLVRGFLHTFWIDFIDEKTRDLYLVDTEHQRIAAELLSMLEGAEQGVFVCDIDM